MTKETVKSAILAGVVGGVTAAATLLISLWLYITIEEWYRDYKRNQTEKQASAIHCCSPGVAEYLRQEDSLVVSKDTLD